VKYVLIALTTVLLAVLSSVLLFRDQLINEFIRQANTRLDTRITIGKVQVNAFRNFPNLSLDFYNVYVEDTHPGQYPLLTAGRISFTFNPLRVLQGTYTANGLIITDCEINLKINANGEINYQLFKNADAQSSSVSFDLNDIDMRACRVRYINLMQADDMEFFTDRLQASISVKDQQYYLRGKGDVKVDKFRTGTTTWPAPKTFRLNAKLIYDDSAGKIHIQPSEIRMAEVSFRIQGSYQWKDKAYIHIQVAGEDASLQTLTALFPPDKEKLFNRYQSRGNAYFNLRLSGVIAQSSAPALEMEFRLDRARIFHPDYHASLDDVKLEGLLQLKNLRNPATATLTLNRVSGQLNDKPFSGHLTVRNFTDPDVSVEFQGDMDIHALLQFYPLPTVHEASGTLRVNVSFEGKTRWLKQKTTAQRITTRGTIDMNNLSLLLGDQRLPLHNLNGSLQFSNNDLALSNVSGRLGKSDFRLNGFFKNIITFLFFKNQPLGIEADLTADFIDLSELFAFAFGTPTKKGSAPAFSFSISPLVNLKFQGRVGQLRFNRFRAHNLGGDLQVVNQVALSKNISFSSLGGNVLLTGSLEAKNPKVIEASGGMLLDGIHIDSAFYVFNNFGQTFIQDRNLKGRAFAEIMLSAKLKPDLTLFAETLTADIQATIKNGELNNFEPLLKLSKYIDDSNLHAVRFADLSNDIHIERSTIFIPMMEVVSNASVLQISGTHRFDQQIDYRIVTLLQNNRMTNLQEAGAAMEIMDGKPKLFLRITGTTDNYRVLYDTEAVRRKIASDLKREVQELKDLFRKKQKKKEATLSSETFDW
jgi:hypothetical protein